MIDKGARAAFGPRQRFAPRLRQAAYVGLSRRTMAAGLLRGRPPGQEPPAPPADYLRLRPEVRSSRELADLAARVNWYLPDARLPVVVQRAPGTEVAPEHAPWMEPELVREPRWLDAAPRGRAHDVVHRITLRQSMTVLRRGRSSVVADPNFYSVAGLGWV